MLKQLKQIGEILADLGWPTKPSKSVNAVTKLVWLRIDWTIHKTCFVPEKKAIKYDDVVTKYRNQTQPRISLPELRSLIGILI